jgi:hypothetical protein
VKARKEEEKRQRMEEVERMKALKKEEVVKKLEIIRKNAGAEGTWYPLHMDAQPNKAETFICLFVFFFFYFRL